ncbi:hypothetical protein DSO57_1031077 [Entomophthora muscae]|uniref:Uncharacterized protein n=1 Tax=Entomophthora muscae TaxID=34485 RepID=A0ACC2UAC6_9FUNG|nr:hypothetical protein DSO57_1031077 [Entomophthora muscae]
MSFLYFCFPTKRPSPPLELKDKMDPLVEEQLLPVASHYYDYMIPYMGGMRPWATVVSYSVRLAPVMYLAFQAQPVTDPR